MSEDRAEYDREDRQEPEEEELGETQKAVAAGVGTAVGLIAFVAIGLAAGLPDMAVFWSSMATAAVLGIYLGGGHYA